MAEPETPSAGRSKGRVSRNPLVLFAAITAAVAALGVAGGFAWAAIAPRVAVVVTGHGAAQVVNPETKAFIAADGWFCIIGAAGGLLAAVIGYLVAVRRCGAVAAAGLILGGLAASIVQWRVGRNIGPASFRSALLTSRTGTVLHAPLSLRAHAALLVWPLASALVVGLVEMLVGERFDQIAQRSLAPPPIAPPIAPPPIAPPPALGAPTLDAPPPAASPLEPPSVSDPPI